MRFSHLGIVLSVFVVAALFGAGSALAATEFRIGVAPSLIDAGELIPGQTKLVKFDVVTPSEDPLLIYMELEQGGFEFFADPKYSGGMGEFSEQDIVGWIKLLDNPVELSTSDEQVVGGSQARGHREVRFLIEVPANAEPGYHVLKVRPIPATPSETLGQAGARVVAVTSVTVVFKVRGAAVREGVILDVVESNYIGNRLTIDSFFSNPGTVTVSARAAQKIYSGENLIDQIYSSVEKFAPGESRPLKTFITAPDVGQYRIETTVEYTTGSASTESFVTVEQPAPAPTPEQQAQGGGFPTWIVIVIIAAIVIISVVVYKWYNDRNETGN